MSLVKFREKKIRFFSFDFRQNFEVRTFSRWLSIRVTKFFWRDIQNIFFKMFTWSLLDGFLNGFSQFGFFIVEICILIWDFRVIFENYSIRMLSKRGNDFIAHWAYAEFSRMHSQRKNVNSFYMYSYAEHTGKWFIAPWAHEEMISSLTEHTRNVKSRISRPSRIRFSKISCYRPLGSKGFGFCKKVYKNFHACVPLNA